MSTFTLVQFRQVGSNIVVDVPLVEKECIVAGLIKEFDTESSMRFIYEKSGSEILEDIQKNRDEYKHIINVLSAYPLFGDIFNIDNLKKEIRNDSKEDLETAFTKLANFNKSEMNANSLIELYNLLQDIKVGLANIPNFKLSFNLATRYNNIVIGSVLAINKLERGYANESRKYLKRKLCELNHIMLEMSGF